jgi:FtsZ-interacting cell division protein ZipA
MSELQIGLVAIGALVVAGVFAYNRLQERGARRDAERSFRSGHQDALMDEPPRGVERPVEPTRAAARAEPVEAAAQPDPKIDYVIELSLERPASGIEEQWKAIERRHAPRALLSGSADGLAWRAGLQLVSRDGVAGEADLIEFRSGVETLAAGIGATVSAPEMRAAIEAARELDEFCAEADIQVVIHVASRTDEAFAADTVRSAAEAAGMAREADGRFTIRDPAGHLLYALGARDGAPADLSLALDLARAPDTQRSFEAMARLAQHLAATLGGQLEDDNGNALDERALAAIAQQLDGVRAKLAAHGVPAGSALALRLFS